MLKLQAIVKNARGAVRIVTGYGVSSEECRADLIGKLKRGELIDCFDEVRKAWSLEVTQ
jgi:hypothetical protein